VVGHFQDKYHNDNRIDLENSSDIENSIEIKEIKLERQLSQPLSEHHMDKKSKAKSKGNRPGSHLSRNLKKYCTYKVIISTTVIFICLIGICIILLKTF
jgi:hypothetical protein